VIPEIPVIPEEKPGAEIIAENPPETPSREEDAGDSLQMELPL